MLKNEIVVGGPRIGELIDGDERTPTVTALLTDTGDQIELTVPIGGMADRTPYARWFSGSSVRYGDDPDRRKYAYKPPRIMLFTDTQGPIVLVGCRADASQASFYGGHGKVTVDYAVLGARHLDYATINGVRIEMPAMPAWAGLHSITFDRQFGDDNRLHKVTIQVEAPRSIQLSRRVNLGLRPTWSTNHSTGESSVREAVELMTATKRARDWNQHLDAVMGVRDLLCLSAWQSFGFTSVRINRGDDPETVLSGDAIGERWCPVASHRFPKHEPWDRDPAFLFTFSDIGPKGVDKWLRLRRRFSRAMSPLVGVLDQPDAYIETKLVQTGIALEALGYQLLLDDGALKPNSRSNPSYKSDLLPAILSDMSFVPLDDPDKWRQRARDSFMGVKHADNPLPDTLDLFNTYRENVLVLRYWLAGRLGLISSEMEARFQRDPLRHQFILEE